MATLVDWIRGALAPRYEVDEELARGRMGAVFRGRDPRLERAVAIKVLLPEFATAATAERFLQEARLLARLQHPHVVPVHEADEAAGLFYYVMDFIDGPTLRDRLQQGPLDGAEALKLGRDLLDALEAVHTIGFVHRDVKPSNVFVSHGRALLADFGIAKSPANGPGEKRLVGTPAYMPPEQQNLSDVTPQTDLYAASMVIYEAMTGRRWPVGVAPQAGEWSGVPRARARVLARGLEPDPPNRWPDAATFRHRLWHTRVRRYRARTAWLTAAGITVGALAFGIPRWRTPTPLRDERLVIGIAQPAYRGPPTEAWLADSVPDVYARLMASAPDFRVCTPSQSCPRATIRLRSTVTVTDSQFQLSVQYRGPDRIEDVFHGEPHSLDDWAAEVHHAADAGFRTIWNANSPLRDWLPVAALPKSDDGYEAWFRAERRLNQAQWQDALSAFTSAFALDSTCLLCSWRITEIQRWLVQPPDAVHLLRTRHNADRFPPHYRPLIQVRWLPLHERLNVLHDATLQWPGFPYAWFLLGEELFHRGPLAARSRSEAVPAFERATELDPSFGPAWEHLAWASIAAGDAPRARHALDAYEGLLNQSLLADDFAVVIQTLMGLGFAWRFSPETAAQTATTILRDPSIASYPDIGAGPRLLGTFDSRQGMRELGDLVLQMPRSDPAARYSARLAIVLALLAEGRVQEARHQIRSIAAQYPERPGVSLFAIKLDAVLTVLDSSAVPLDRAALAAELSSYTEHSGTDPENPGAAWMRAVLDAVAHRAVPNRQDLLPESLAAILRATAAGNADSALAMTAPDVLPLVAETLQEHPRLEAHRLPDPFYRTLLRFFRARWHAEIGKYRDAADELRFHEAWDLAGRPVDLPEAGEIDWAFGTLARWWRATWLQRTPQPAKACEDLHVVAGRWAKGDALFKARADSARDALNRLGCDPLPAAVGW